MKQRIRQFVVFSAVGLVNTGTTLVLILSLIRFLGVQPLVANFLGYALGVIVSFTLNRTITFQDRGHIHATGFRFLGGAALAYLFNLLAIAGSQEIFGVSVYLAQVIGNIAYTLSFFILCRWVIFREPSELRGIVLDQTKTQTPVDWVEIGFSILKVWVIAGLVLWLIDTVGFSPLDDHQFATTILQGKPFKPYIFAEGGRFYPLVAQEYVAISQWFGHEASVFYRIGVLKLVLFGWLLAVSIARMGQSRGVAFALWLLGVFSFPIAGTLFRLHAGDLNAAMLLLGYLIFVQEVMSSSASERRRGMSVWFGVLLAVLSSFYKESIAVLLFVFSGMEILRLRLQKEAQRSLYHLPIFIYTLSFLVIYKIWAGHPGDANYALTHQISRGSVIWGFFTTSPSLFVIVLPVLLIRLFRNGKNWMRYGVCDVLLAAGFSYLVLFVSLGMYNQYYSLPGMVFALVGLAGILVDTPRDRFLARMVPALAMLITLENAPAVLSEFAHQRQVVINHGRFVQFMKEWSPEYCATDHQCTMTLDGVSIEREPEIFVSLKSFLGWLVPGRMVVQTHAAVPDQTPWQRLADLGPKGNLVLENPFKQGALLPMGPSLRNVFDSGDGGALPLWRLHEWIGFCGVARELECRESVRAHTRFAGYRLFMKARESLPVTGGEALRHPRYDMEVESFPSVVRKEEEFFLDLLIWNTGTEVWPADAGTPNAKPVHVAYRWLLQNGNILQEGDRSPLPEAILPEESFEATLKIKSPREPGFYRLEITLVQENVLWFPSQSYRDVLVRPR